MARADNIPAGANLAPEAIFVDGLALVGRRIWRSLFQHLTKRSYPEEELLIDKIRQS